LGYRQGKEFEPPTQSTTKKDQGSKPGTNKATVGVGGIGSREEGTRKDPLWKKVSPRNTIT